MMNLPSVAGVLNFQNYANQLNNANAGVKNLVGMANDWAKTIQAQNNQAAQTEKQNQVQAARDAQNFANQQALQNERFEHELGMFDKQQERQLKNDARKFRTSLYDFDNIKPSDKAETNDLNELKIRNKIQEVTEHPEYFSSDEEYVNTSNALTRKANEIMVHNKGIKVGNTLDKEFKEYRDGDFRNAQAMSDWLADNIDYIQTYRPDMEQKVYATLERKQREQDEDNLKWAMLQNQMRNSNISTRKNIKQQSDEDWAESLK